MLKIAVIGGGPAGFMAALSAFEHSEEKIAVDIYEKAESLKTILVTGNGRCNLTNDIKNFKEIALNYPRGEKFLYSAFSRFGASETMQWFRNNGVELYTQEDNRVFPVTDDANTVRDMLIDKARSLGISIKNYTSIDRVLKIENKFKVYSKNLSMEYDRVIVATGGNLKPHNAGYEIAKLFGHVVTPLKPSLAGFVLSESWTRELAGVSVKDTEIKVLLNSKLVKKAVGDFVFTHKGISGPLALKLSAYCAFLEYDKENPIVIEVNFKPDFQRNELEQDFMNELNQNSKKDIANILKKYLPKSIVEAFLYLVKIDAETKANQISKENRKSIVNFLTQLKFHSASTVPDGEIVTAGGIDLNEINSKTMESKLESGLYFCGEILNVDGLTGGFNLQACWSTGYIAGMSSVS